MEAKRLTFKYYGQCLCEHYNLSDITLIELQQFVRTQLKLTYNRLKLNVEQKQILEQIGLVINQSSFTL